MPIITPQGIDLQASSPVELKVVSVDRASILNITEVTRYKGLEVYAQLEDKKYMFRAGTSDADLEEQKELRNDGNGNAYLLEWLALGHTSPQAQLDVDGDGIFSGNLSINNALVVGGDTELRGNLQVIGDITAPNIYTKDDFIWKSAGVADAGKPIVLNYNGVIDPSLISINSLHYVGPFTPDSTNPPTSEYPDTTNENAGAFWIVSGLTTILVEYVFVDGPLVGQKVHNGDYMVWNGGNDWSIVIAGIDVTEFYARDGSQPITADFVAAGFRLTGVADAINANDAVTLQQMNAHTAADSNRLGGELPSYYQNASNITAGTLDNARLNTLINSSTTGNAATATKLETARTISLTGDVTAAGVPFDGSGNIVLTTSGGGKWLDLDSDQGITYYNSGKGIGIDIPTTELLWEERGLANITMIADSNIRDYNIAWVPAGWGGPGYDDWVAAGVTDGAFKIEANDQTLYSSDNILELYNQGTLRFRVSKDGDVNCRIMTVAGMATSSTTLVSNLNADRVDNYHASISSAANTLAVRDSSQNITAHDFILSSDRRLKEDIKPLEIGIDGLKPVSFRFKDGGELQYGFIAQDMLETHPELVTGTGEVDEDGNINYYSIKTNSIIALLVKEVQELKKKLEDK